MYPYYCEPGMPKRQKLSPNPDRDADVSRLGYDPIRDLYSTNCPSSGSGVSLLPSVPTHGFSGDLGGVAQTSTRARTCSTEIPYRNEPTTSLDYHVKNDERLKESPTLVTAVPAGIDSNEVVCFGVVSHQSWESGQ